MDDFGNDYRMYMSTQACYMWYISMNAYGGEPVSPYGIFPV